MTTESEADMTDDGSPLYYAVAEGDDYRRVLAMTDERERKGRVSGKVYIVFDAPPGPVCGRFVEVEDSEGKSIRFGKWIQEGAYWLLEVDEP